AKPVGGAVHQNGTRRGQDHGEKEMTETTVFLSTERASRRACRTFRLVWLNSRKLDHPGPFVGLVSKKFAEFCGRERKRTGAHFGQSRFQPGISEPGFDLSVEPIDDFKRRVPGCADTQPGTYLIARHEICDARDVRQHLGPGGSRHGQWTNLPAPDV